MGMIVDPYLGAVRDDKVTASAILAAGGVLPEVNDWVGIRRALPRTFSAANIALISGRMHLTYFTAGAPVVMTAARTVVTTAQSGTAPTLTKYGLYSVASNGNLALLSATANDTLLFSALGLRSAALTTPVTLVPGQRYALALLTVSTGAMPALQASGASYTMVEDASTGGGVANFIVGQTDMPAFLLGGSLAGGAAFAFYFSWT